MSRPETCRIAAMPADYQRYGIAKGEIAAREDGFRTRPGGPGTFEWWYFDAVLDDGSTLVINFMVKDIRSGRGIKQPARPVVTFELDRPDGTHVERALQARDDFAFGADRCDVRVGASTFAGDLQTYRIHLELDAVTADVTLTGQVPSWRPETGHILFGDDQPHVFAWLPAVPQGTVRATLTVDDETRTLTGIGYHDHNWGDAAMPQLINHWYWARAQAGGYCVIASHITAERKYGHTQVPIFMLARDGKILADDSSLVRLRSQSCLAARQDACSTLACRAFRCCAVIRWQAMRVAADCNEISVSSVMAPRSRVPGTGRRHVPSERARCRADPSDFSTRTDSGDSPGHGAACGDGDA